jgi:hypothetical protein
VPGHVIVDAPALATMPVAVKPEGSASRNVRNGRTGRPARGQGIQPGTETRVAPLESVVTEGGSNEQVAVSTGGEGAPACTTEANANVIVSPMLATVWR